MVEENPGPDRDAGLVMVYKLNKNLALNYLGNALNGGTFQWHSGGDVCCFRSVVMAVIVVLCFGHLCRVCISWTLLYNIESATCFILSLFPFSLSAYVCIFGCLVQVETMPM